MFTGLLAVISLINNLGCIHATQIYSQKNKVKHLTLLDFTRKNTSINKIEVFFRNGLT